MSRGWYGRRGRPPWWPENEPFPPPGGWRGGRPWGARGGFVRHVVAFLFVAVILAVIAATFIFWLLATALGAPDLSGGIARGALLLLVFMALGFATRSLRRLAAPVADVIDAVERVAEGDLTARVRERGPRAARALARSFNAMTARLAALEEQRRRVLADVSHELRTPLSVVQGQLEALIDGVHPADEPHLRAILEETEILSRLVEDLRTLSLAEAGALALHRESVDIGALARDTTVSFADRAAGAGVRIETAVPADLPAADADPVRVREILANLVANAIRYTPSGGLVRVAARGEGPTRISVSVADTGRGIDAESLPRVFDRFYKSPESRGAGLGLAIAKQLVTAHGGEIAATSVIGEGTEFRFTLPTENAT